ncbi:MAG: Gfo/Idh/MocA family oxidoreductase [Clostridia bacterium]|nr:Gfo/Idh/MocA family oxidoreductase [Clostridia bacterium]
MNKKIVTVSIIGVGGRGGEAYGRYMSLLKDKFRITHLCDINQTRLDKYGEIFEVPKENRFDDENRFFEKKWSDLLFITTQDRMHVRMAKKALELGYDIVLEKPISDSVEELQDLTKLAHEKNRKVIVCHVLRYTVFMKKLKELLNAGEIGRLVSIDQTENVVFWHEAHSYVRGNWRNTDVAVPMIMAKCCHDLDLIQDFAGSRCKSVASMGSLFYFKPENKPDGSADRCVNCKLANTCVYSAKRIYVEMWKNVGTPENAGPFNLITDACPLTEDALMQAITDGPYGRCAFSCDNNVVDNQTVIMQFENGVTATLKMEAFVKQGGRDIRFFGTEGELDLCEADGTITLKKYFDKDVVWRLNDLTDDLEGHGGGDHRMIDSIYEIMTNDSEILTTSIDNSVESHYMALAAEESRINGGKLVELKKFRK